MLRPSPTRSCADRRVVHPVYTARSLLIQQSQEITLDTTDCEQLGLISPDTHQPYPNLRASFDTLLGQAGLVPISELNHSTSLTSPAWSDTKEGGLDSGWNRRSSGIYCSGKTERSVTVRGGIKIPVCRAKITQETRGVVRT
jgi:hypothetical protein